MNAQFSYFLHFTRLYTFQVSLFYVLKKIGSGSDLLLNISLAGGQLLKVDKS